MNPLPCTLVEDFAGIVGSDIHPSHQAFNYLLADKIQVNNVQAGIVLLKPLYAVAISAHCPGQQYSIYCVVADNKKRTP